MTAGSPRTSAPDDGSRSDSTSPTSPLPLVEVRTRPLPAIPGLPTKPPAGAGDRDVRQVAVLGVCVGLLLLAGLLLALGVR